MCVTNDTSFSDDVIARIIQSELSNNLSSADLSSCSFYFGSTSTTRWSIVQPSHSGQTQGSARSNNKLIYIRKQQKSVLVSAEKHVKDLPVSSSFTHHTQQPRLSLLASLLLHQDDEEEEQQ